MLKAGITTKELLSSLRHNSPLLNDTTGTFYSERNNLKNENFMGRTPIETLLDEVNQAGWRSSISLDGENKPTNISFASKQSGQRLRQYPYILVMDFTYKIYRFIMLILHII